MDKASDFGSEDCRFESCHDRKSIFPFLVFKKMFSLSQCTVELIFICQFHWLSLEIVQKHKRWSQTLNFWSKQILESDEVLKGTEALKKTLEHLAIINKDLVSIFTKNNIKPIDCLNKKLDPNLHQAMMEIEDDEKEPGTIIQEVQKGFMIKERLLRPSLVGVSKKKDQKDEENKENLDK